MQCIAFTLSTGAQLGRCAPKRGKTRQKRPLFGYRLITRFYRPRLACCHARQGARSAAAGQRGTLPPRCRHHEHEVGGRARGQPADHEDGVERHRETPISAAIESRVSLACSGKFTGTESAGLRTCLPFACPATISRRRSRCPASAPSVIPGVMVPGRDKARLPVKEAGFEKRMPLRGDGAMGPFTIPGAAFSPRGKVSRR